MARQMSGCMSLALACVLQSGGEYGPEHVGWLKQQIERVSPGVPFLCLSDVPVPCPRIPLSRDLPGWWSKIELLDPSMPFEDVLFFDLDTVIVGDISKLIGRTNTTIMRDVYRGGDALQSSVMYLTKRDRLSAWEVWTRFQAKFWMDKYAHLGDQGFFEDCLPECDRWQDCCPGALVSYKAHILPPRNERHSVAQVVPKGAKVVVFHGRPRPWQVNLPWIPKLEKEAAA